MKPYNVNNIPKNEKSKRETPRKRKCDAAANKQWCQLGIRMDPQVYHHQMGNGSVNASPCITQISKDEYMIYGEIPYKNLIRNVACIVCVLFMMINLGLFDFLQIVKFNSQ